MRARALLVAACVVLLAFHPGSAATAAQEELRVKDVASATAVPPAQLEANTAAFSDRQGEFADPVTGLLRFEDWERTRPVQKRLLSLYPGYVEPTLNVTIHGVTKPYQKKLHIYVGEARFMVAKAPGSIEPARYASLRFIEKIDPAITHRPILATEALPNSDPESAYNRHPSRRWCETGGLCLASHYALEGKLPLGIRLANKLEEGGKKIAEAMEFQSELRPLSAQDIAAADLPRLTKLDTPVTGALEQNTFAVNQILTFAKFLAVFQAHPTDPGKTVVTAFMTLAIKSDVLEKKKEFERVPVLRNLVPAQVLVGASSFNTGSSISAGLPKYARNRIQRLAELMRAE
jgi:hypothetical protein